MAVRHSSLREGGLGSSQSLFSRDVVSMHVHQHYCNNAPPFCLYYMIIDLTYSSNSSDFSMVSKWSSKFASYNPHSFFIQSNRKK
jgi:hypothetical protein